MHFTPIAGLLLLSVSTGQVLCHLEPQLYSGYILAIPFTFIAFYKALTLRSANQFFSLL